MRRCLAFTACSAMYRFFLLQRILAGSFLSNRGLPWSFRQMTESLHFFKVICACRNLINSEGKNVSLQAWESWTMFSDIMCAPANILCLVRYVSTINLLLWFVLTSVMTLLILTGGRLPLTSYGSAMMLLTSVSTIFVWILGRYVVTNIKKASAVPHAWDIISVHPLNALRTEV